MTSSNILNIVGLILDIIGVIMLFKYGLPPSINRDGAVYIAINEEDLNEKEEANKYIKLSSWALGLLIGGFVLQLSANLIPIICDLIHKG